MATFLITGGAGFIGTNYCQYVVEKYPNDFFICYDALTYAGSLEGLEKIKGNKNFKFYHGNICDKKKLIKIFTKYKIDVIINFAAETHVDRSIEASEVFVETNIKGTHTLLELAKAYNISRFHQVSTDEVYGDLDNKASLFTEESALHPSNPYSASKAAADMLVMSYMRTYNLSCSISRCSNNYGPYQNSEKFIPMIIQKSIDDKSIPIYGDGLNRRNWIYVLDHCIAVDLIVRNAPSGKIYNIASEHEVENIELAKMILKYLEKEDVLLTFVKDRKGHDFRYSMDISKIKNDLNWKPHHSIDVGLQKTIEWYKEKYKKA
ncbi:MAG: dTDP-glucose 4,6-dehydratase [Anaeroplasmataceae bacterium]|nr:dTDP-glucose 4,6-dehydratase [Anaeroplasmataceae bacterium]